MGAKVSAPKPTPEERALQAAQKQSIDIQNAIMLGEQRQNKILLPFLAEQQGYDVTVDSEGVLTSIKKRPDPDEDVRKEIEREFNQRTLKALKGELPVDPALERDLTSQREQLQNKMASQFGPGYE